MVRSHAEVSISCMMHKRHDVSSEPLLFSIRDLEFGLRNRGLHDFSESHKIEDVGKQITGIDQLRDG